MSKETASLHCCGAAAAATGSEKETETQPHKKRRGEGGGDMPLLHASLPSFLTKLLRLLPKQIAPSSSSAAATTAETEAAEEATAPATAAANAAPTASAADSASPPPHNTTTAAADSLIAAAKESAAKQSAAGSLSRAAGGYSAGEASAGNDNSVASGAGKRKRRRRPRWRRRGDRAAAATTAAAATGGEETSSATAFGEKKELAATAARIGERFVCGGDIPRNEKELVFPLPTAGASVGCPWPLSPFDYFWTYEEDVAAENAAARMTVQQQRRLQQQQRSTPVELLELQTTAYAAASSASIKQQENSLLSLPASNNSRTSSRQQQQQQQQVPSAAALLLQDVMSADEEEEEEEEEAALQQVEAERENMQSNENKRKLHVSSSSSSSTSSRRVEETTAVCVSATGQQSTFTERNTAIAPAAVGSDKHLLLSRNIHVAPVGFASYTYVLPTNAAPAPPAAAGVTAAEAGRVTAAAGGRVTARGGEGEVAEGGMSSYIEAVLARSERAFRLEHCMQWDMYRLAGAYGIPPLMFRVLNERLLQQQQQPLVIPSIADSSSLSVGGTAAASSSRAAAASRGDGAGERTNEVLATYRAVKENKKQQQQLRALFHYMETYLDICYCNEDYGSTAAVREVAALHAASHIFKAQTRVLRHSSLVEKKLAAVAAASGENSHDENKRTNFLRRLKQEQQQAYDDALAAAATIYNRSAAAAAAAGSGVAAASATSAEGRQRKQSRATRRKKRKRVTQAVEAVCRGDEEETGGATADIMSRNKNAAAEAAAEAAAREGESAAKDERNTEQHASKPPIHDAATTAASNPEEEEEEEEEKEKEEGKEEETDGDVETWFERQIRDNGYTRPRVLVLLPFRSAAKEFVESFLQYMPRAHQVLNRRRFEEEFGLPSAEAAEQQQRFAVAKRTADYISLFQGNDDDCFRMGIRVSKKAAILFSPFAAADVIVASPLGLRALVGVEGDKSRDYDFLSSIEVVIVDRADVVGLQNWALLRECFAALNLPPAKYTAYDIRRLRAAAIAGVLTADRQTIVLANGRDPRYFSLFKSYCCNRRGLLHLFDPGLASRVTSVLPAAAYAAVPTLTSSSSSSLQRKKKQKRRKQQQQLSDKEENEYEINETAEEEENSDEEQQKQKQGLKKKKRQQQQLKITEAMMGNDIVAQCTAAGVQQLFCRIHCSSFVSSSEALVRHLIVRVLPTCSGGFSRGAVVVLPSYLEYCRLWKALKEKNIDYVRCHEYTSNAKITKARQKFQKGEVPLLVTTVRFLFFRRYRLSGGERVIFVGPPISPEVYGHVLLCSLPDAAGSRSDGIPSPQAHTFDAAQSAKNQRKTNANSSAFHKTGASICFFTKYNAYQLERLMGVDKATALINAPETKIVAVK